MLYIFFTFEIIENFTEAKEILLRAKERISKSMSFSEAYCQKLTEDLRKAAEIMKSKNVYDAGAHYIICRSVDHEGGGEGDLHGCTRMSFN